MNTKPLLLIPALSLVLLLSACAGPMPQPDPKEAWISLEEEGPSDLLAERVDGKNVDDGRYFEVQPGAHRLDVTLFEEVGGDSDQVDCRGHVSYPNFQAGEHYKLVESTLGTEVRARLFDAQGKQVASAHGFECMPG
ncbi:PA0061/PA0062 family lipoprotein [Pseudomonas chlororaphis]|uniref:PA0061/PA0062 family lipoprotein n=1 Tax=Pseudomonas chlororaphis TaxID=587753 RepID=UPI001CF1E4C9|nr:hypothetical protein [Pseudomonas chlororaphis]UCR85309.1 hypothetical protein K9V45_04005 [Pseudomonas chlororaphis]